MASNIKKKRVSRQYQVFFFACLASLIGLLVYILGAKRIPFPDKWMPLTSEGKGPEKGNLFFSGISIHLQVNFVIGLFFILLNPDKMDPVKMKRWRLWISRTLIFLFSLGAGFMKYWENVKEGGWGSILLLCLIVTVINCCLLELLIQLMNQYGICNAFNLILLTEFLPYNWFAKNWNNPEPMLYLALITVAFIWITSLKWEAPIETNTLHSQNSKILKKRKSKLGFRFSLSFMPLIQLSQFVGWIYNLVLMRSSGVNWGSLTSIRNGWNGANQTRATESTQGLKTSLKNEGGTFWGSFLLLNDAKYIFAWENLKDWFWNKKWWIVGALFFTLFLRWLAVWVQMRKVNPWKTGEMSKDLRSRGIYINQVAPGHATRNLLRKVINKIILSWYFIILVFNIIFDNIFNEVSPLLPFFNWFGSVNIGTDLVRQIRTKYKYIKTNR